MKLETFRFELDFVSNLRQVFLSLRSRYNSIICADDGFRHQCGDGYRGGSLRRRVGQTTAHSGAACMVSRLGPLFGPARKRPQLSNAGGDSSNFWPCGARPSRCGGRGDRWRVGSTIACAPFPRRLPKAAESGPRPPVGHGQSARRAEMGRGMVMLVCCVPLAFGPSGEARFLVRWRVQGRPTVRGPAGNRVSRRCRGVVSVCVCDLVFDLSITHRE